MKKYAMNLQLFAEDGAAAAPAGGGAITGTAAETGTIANDIQVGDTLGDGTQVTDARVAAALNRQMNRHPELRKVYGQNRQQEAPQQVQETTGQSAETPAGNAQDDLQSRWEAAKKGEFKDLYGQDVAKAVQDRFRNQNDAKKRMEKLGPAIEVLMQQAGVNDEDAFINLVMNDDSRFEEEAEERGMTVEQLKEFKTLEKENARMKKAEESAQIRQHIDNLIQQGEELKTMFPGFDFNEAMNDPKFRAMTSQDVGLTVRQAYMALHGDELIPQLMAYGMQRAQQQMGQTIQAQRARPAEGAMSGKNQAAAEPRLNPNNLKREERNKLKEWVKLHGPISFDGGGPR